MEFPLVQYARVIKCVYETPVLLHVHDYFIQASLERIIGWELARMRDEQLREGVEVGMRVAMSLSGARARSRMPRWSPSWDEGLGRACGLGFCARLIAKETSLHRRGPGLRSK